MLLHAKYIELNLNQECYITLQPNRTQIILYLFAEYQPTTGLKIHSIKFLTHGREYKYQ